MVDIVMSLRLLGHGYPQDRAPPGSPASSALLSELYRWGTAETDDVEGGGKMFLGAVTDQVRGCADEMGRRAQALVTMAGALRADVAGVTWAGPDRDDFDRKVIDALARMDACGEYLSRHSSCLEEEANQQDAASGPDSAGAGVHPAPWQANGGRDQDDPAQLEDMAPAVPYDKSEAEAEQNVGSRGIEQGSLNDCWYLVALMGIAERDPDYIRDHMWQNEDGTWTVTMYKDGEPVEIIVDSEFSPDAARHRVPKLDAQGDVILDADGQPVMEAVPGGWPAIYEKAAVEYRSRFGDPDYEHIEWGWGDEGYEMLTPHGAERTGESDFEDIAERFEKGPVTVASEHPDGAILYPPWEGKIDDTTVVPRHEYNVAGFIPAGERAPDGTTAQEDRIHLENPWGPEGGSYGGNERAGDLYMTEEQYKENFRGVSSVEMGA